MAGADRDGARLLRDGLGRAGLTEAEIAELRQVLRSSGAVEEIERRIHALAEPALAELAAAPLAEPARSVLVDLGGLPCTASPEPADPAQRARAAALRRISVFAPRASASIGVRICGPRRSASRPA